jgi:vacuolar-type H+-ATPase subunit E/Vma4
MPKSRFELPAQLPTTVTRPIYAGVGVTDLAVEFVREYVADVQKRAGEVQKTVSGIDYQPATLATEAQKRAQSATKVVTERVETLNKSVADDAQARRAAVEKRVAELQAEAKAFPTRLQKFLDEQLGTAGDTYGELVTRGESLVDRILRQESTQEAEKAAKTTVAKAKTTKTQASKTAATAKKSAQKSVKKSADSARKSPAKSSAKATVTAAKKAAESTAAAVVDAAEKVGD